VTALVIVAAVVGWLYVSGRLPRIRSRRTGPGVSAAARARQLRTPAVRLADLVGIQTRAGALADRSEVGGEGERRTAARLAPLERHGWTLLHDRRLPRGRANVDHLTISPTGVVLVLDTKVCSARWPVTIRAGRLFHGDRDITSRLNGLRYEADTVAKTLGVPVHPVALIDGARLLDEPLHLDGIRILPAAHTAAWLPALASGYAGHPQPARLAAHANRAFPPYLQGHH
jgi:hypothetical protein